MQRAGSNDVVSCVFTDLKGKVQTQRHNLQRGHASRKETLVKRSAAHLESQMCSLQMSSSIGRPCTTTDSRGDAQLYYTAVQCHEQLAYALRGPHQASRQLCISPRLCTWEPWQTR